MSGWFETIDCGWCGARIELSEGILPRDTYAIERGDGDKFYLCSLDHALWLLADWESSEWLDEELARP